MIINLINMLTDTTTKTAHRSIQLLGLTNDHAELYLTLLQLGESPVSKIAKKAKLPRTTVYDYLEALIDTGLVTKNQNETKLLFSPVEPQVLNRMIKERLDIVQDNSYNLERSLFELEALYSSHSQSLPRVRFFQGERGLKTALYDSLNCDELLTTCQGSVEYQTGNETEPRYLMDFIEEAFTRKLKSREIIVDTPSAREYLKRLKRLGYKETDVILIPNRNDIVLNHVDKHIYDGKIGYISHDSLVAVIIEDDALYQHEKLQFEALWEHYSKR